MIYKRPVITLTSLLDLLFIIIFAYQIEIKSNADKYVQAEVSRIAPQNLPQGGTIASEQKELIAEIRAENRRVKDELEFVREKAESATKNAYEYKSQSEKYETQRDLLLEKIRDERKRTKDDVNNELQVEVYKQQVKELKNELQRKEKELLAVKQEKKRIKKQTKSEGVIPITERDAKLAKALVGTWRGNYNRGPMSRTESVTYYADGRFTGSGTITAIRDFTLFPSELYMTAGQSLSYQISGSWWIKSGYRYLLVESSSSATAFRVGYSVKDRISFTTGNRVRFMRDEDNIPYELYRN